MSWYTDIKTWIANNIRTNHQREITGAKMNTVLNDIVDEVDRKVNKVSGKGLSTNDYNNTEKAKVANAYSKPSGGIPKTDLASAVQTSLGKADTAVQTETDPTVPSWAKAQTKPVYTASEVGAIPAADKGANGGVAILDNAGKVPQSQLPSYVDDVQEYTSLAQFPATGESGKIYVALDTNKTYRWSGSAYVEISQSLALGETSSTAFPGDRGKAIEDKIPSNASSSNKLATKAEMVPAGGTTGQVLAKKSNTDNDLEWVNQSGGGGTVDPYPTEGSTNPVQSGGVFTALANLIADGCLYGGIVNPYSEPSDDKRFFYISETEGVYTHFDNLELNGKNLFIIHWDNFFETWTMNSFGENHEGIEQDIAQRFNQLYLDLGFDNFSPYTSYAPNDYVTYIEIGGLWRFNTNHQGVWDENDVDQVTLVDYIDDLLIGKQDTISDLATIRSGAAAGATAYQKPSGGIPKTDLASGVQTSLGKADTAFQKPSGGIPASDLSTAVQTSLGKADTAVQTESDPVFSASPAAGITSGNISSWNGKAEPIEIVDASTPPMTMQPDKVYQYGTLSGDTTFPLLLFINDGKAHIHCWTFTTPATAPTITWPSAITSWAGGSAPTINASKSYEVSVMDGFATIIEN